MAQGTRRRAGRSAARAGRSRSAATNAVLAAAFAAALAAAFGVWLLLRGAVGDGAAWAAGAAAAGLAAAAAGRFAVSRRVDASKWTKGAEGEKRTGRALAKELGSSWWVGHDILVPGTKANVDHLVVGPPGVFVVDSKNLSGALRVDGGVLYQDDEDLTRRVRATRWEADKIAEALGADALRGRGVEPVWAVWGAKLKWRGRRTVGGVSLVSGKSVAASLRSRPAVLSVEDVLRARAAAKRLKRAR